MSSFWQRAREARLVRVLAVYIGASWVLLQLTALLREEFQLPQWLTPVAAVLLLVGLVIITTTAWVQAQGRVGPHAEAKPAAWEVGLADLKDSVTRGRLPHLTWARAILGGIFAFSLLFGFAGLYVLLTGRVPSVPGPKEAVASAAPGMAVLPFRVVGGPELELWREGMVDLLATNLDGVAGLRSNDPRTLLNRWRSQVGEGNDQPDLSVALAIADGVGARYAVLGSAVDLGSGVRVTANIYEVGSGDQVGRAQVEGSADDVLSLVDELSIQVIQQVVALSPGELPQFDVREITTQSLEALKAFLAGEQQYRRGLWNEAVTNYQGALDEDSTFALALIRMSQAYGWAEGFSQRSMEFAQRAARHSERLPERAALMVRAFAEFEEQRRSSIESLKRLTDRYPDDSEALFYLGDAYFHLGDRALHGPENHRQIFRRVIDLDPSYAPAYIHLIEDGFKARDSSAVRELLDAYTSLGPASDEAAAFKLLYDIAWGEASARQQALTALDTLDFAVLLRTGPALEYGDRPWEASAPVLDALVAPRHSAGDRSGAYLRLYGHALARGQLERATEAARASNDVVNGMSARAYEAFLGAWHTIWGYIPAAEPQELGPSTPAWVRFVAGAQAADEGRWNDVETIMQAFQSEAEEAAAEGVEAIRLNRTSFAQALNVHSALRRGDLELAIAEYQQPMPRLGDWTMALLRFSIAKALLEEGKPEEAERYFRSLWEHREARIPSEYYLGQVSEALGEPEQAKLHYARFLGWWENADPDLQPWVESARSALERLTGEARR